MDEEIRIMKTYGNVTTGAGNLLMNATLVVPFGSVYMKRHAPTTDAAVKRLYSSFRIMMGIECGLDWEKL